MNKKLLVLVLIIMSILVAGCKDQKIEQPKIQTASSIKTIIDDAMLKVDQTQTDVTKSTTEIIKTDNTESKANATKTEESKKGIVTKIDNSKSKVDATKTGSSQVKINVTKADSSKLKEAVTKTDSTQLEADATKIDVSQSKNLVNNIDSIKVDTNVTISRDDAMKILNKWCEWNNGTVQAMPEYDRVKTGVRYYYFNVTFGLDPKMDYFVESKNGDIYKANIEKDINADDLPLNKQLQDQQVSYKPYTNDRFGFSIDYPSTFVTKSILDNNDGVILSTLEGSEELTVSGVNNVLNETPISFYNNLLKKHIDAIDKSQEDNWMSVSWIEENKIVYEKVVVGSGSIDTFIIKYPASQKDYYIPIITHFNSTFKTPLINIVH